MKVNILEKDYTIKKGSILRISDVESGEEKMVLVILTDTGYQLLDIDECSIIQEKDDSCDITSPSIFILKATIEEQNLEVLNIYNSEDFEINQVR